jgi:hypothetical protein
MKLPLAHYAFSSCNLYRTFPSLNDGLPVTTLSSSRPELIKCDPTDGLSLDADLLLSQPDSLSYLEGQSSLANLQEQSNTSLGWTFATWFTPGLRGAAQGTSPLDPIFTIGAFERPISPQSAWPDDDDDDLSASDDDSFIPPPNGWGCLGL